ncbi:expressed unknown protein [Ectocarpus siliculosus]|uniref:Uncharacterized protein n=1 Tax=Ectocarpus siliculosus TaxID=2880 RepID=D7FVY6_ECTSI|nr:expressed unknown protein [Ectocarpus siliculosus]|eukprot:CBJ25506.1 expressed unknown protein [Ectocarpus siliculosus]
MPLKTLKNFLVATGPLALFLFVTATMMLQHIAAICDDEWDACFDDAVCNSCYYDWAESMDEYNECIGDYPEIDYGTEVDWCFVYTASDCCKASVSSKDCLGNTAFVDHTICEANYSATSTEKDACTALTCNEGSVTVLFDDDASTATNGADVAEDDDVGAADDYADAVAGDDADRADDDEEDTADDDADVAADTGAASRVGRSSPGVVLTAVRGIAFLIVAPFLAASL